MGSQSTYTLTIEDNDTPGIKVDPATVKVTEGDANGADVKVKLASAPTANVMVSLSDDGASDLSWSGTTLSGNDLTFTPGNWSTVQTVTLTAGQDDDFADDTETLTLTASKSGDYNGETASIAVTIKDDDAAGIQVDPTAVTVTEGDANGAEVAVKLTGKPTTNVTVTLRDDGASKLHWSGPGLSGNDLTFTPGDWSTAQTVTLTAGEDDDFAADTETLTLTASTSGGYNGETASITVTIQDDDAAGIQVDPTVVTVTEGDANGAEVAVKLTGKPTTNVTVTLRDDGASYVNWSGTTLSGNDLTFTPGDWSTAQTVTLTAGEDDDFAADTETLTLTASTSGGYNGETASITVTIQDDDAAGIQVDPTVVTVTEGDANGAEVAVKLTGKPTTNVTVTLRDAGASDLSWSGTTLLNDVLTFTTTNWDQVQTVKVTAGEDDDFADDTETLTLTASKTGGYNGETASVAVTIKDDDTPGLVVPPASVNVNEGASAIFEVKLNGQPSDEVTVEISGYMNTDLDTTASAPRRLTFSSSDWGAKTVTLGAKHDVGFADDTVTLTLTATGSFSETKTVEVTIQDDDAAGIQVDPTAVTVREGDANGAQVEVNLTAKPTGNVTVTLRDAGASDLIWSGTTLSGDDLTFTADNWSTAQTVTLTAGEDDDFTSESETLTLTASGDGYTGASASIKVTIQDDDTPPTSAVVTLSASPTSVKEGESVTVTAMLSPPLSDAVTITLRYEPGEPPTEPGDYDPLSQITIPGGSPSGSETIYIQDDDISEGEERFTVAINGSRLRSGIELGSPPSVEITILDDDPPPPVEVSLSAAPNPVDEGDPVTVTATLTGILETDVDVPLEYNNETTDPPESGDYAQIQSITIPRGETEGSGEIQTLEDADVEDEIFIVSLGDLPPKLLQPGRETFQEVTIRDLSSREVMVNLSAAPNPVDEGKSVTVTATLSEAHDIDVTIPLKLTDDTAEKDEDYQAPPPTQITINAGETIGSYSILAVDDEIAEDDETFTVELGPLPSGLANGEQSWVTVMITDDDEAGIDSPPSVSVVEGGEASFDLSLTSKPLGEVVVTMTWPSGTDLTLQPITRTFTPETWQTNQQVTLIAEVDDDILDDPVEVTLTASGSSDYIGILETVSVTIRDKDTAGLVVNPLSVTMNEGTERTLEIALTQKPLGPVTVNFSGHLGTDLSLSDTPLTFTTSNWSQAQTMTLTAAPDEDIVDDTATLTLTASGGGYDGVTKTVPVMIKDIDEAGIVVERTVTMKEGGTEPLKVRLFAQPSGPVTVNFTGHMGTDLSLSDTPLTFTTSNWSQAQTIILTAAEDEDYETDTIELNLAASGGGYNGEDAPVTVTITDNDERPGPLTITIYDKRELEDAGAIQLPIELSRPTDAVVTVQYASTDGTAESGLDYTASRGIVIFDPGATRGVIEIEITDDEIPESTETFAVTLLKPQNAIIARGTGTGTILDNDGGTAILRVEDALVQEEEGMVRFQVSLSHPQRQMISAAYRTQDGTAKAGEDYEAASGVVTLAPGTVDAMIAVPLLKDGLDWQEETFTVHLESSENAEIAKAVGVATIQAATTVSQEALEAYTARFVRTSATQVVEALGDRFRGADGTACGAATRAEMARLWYSASSWDPSLGELLGGCRMSATSYSGSFSVWGRGAFRQFNGREDDGLTLDGEVTTGMLGADYRWKGGWLAGVLLSHSQGEGSFAAAQESGEITAGLTGVYPYVSVARAGWEVWLSAGAGRGQAEVLELDGDLTSRFGAMGVRGTLVSNSTIGLNYHGDVLVTDAEIEEHAVTAEVYRVRAGVEANAQINNVLRPYVEANVRSDGGSAETGVGLEFGGGMRIAYPAWRLKADVHAQGLVMHTAAGFSEWGISGFVQMGNRSEGLMMRVRPSWGLGQGMSLYGQQTIRDAAPMGANAHRTELELGYGVPWKEGSARSIMGMIQLSQGRMYRLGGELRPWENLTFSIFGLAHGRTASLGDIGLNVRGSLRY